MTEHIKMEQPDRYERDDSRLTKPCMVCRNHRMATLAMASPLVVLAAHVNAGGGVIVVDQDGHDITPAAVQ